MSDSPQTTSNPFPGLRPFRTDEHHLFFGREVQTAELLRLLGDHRFIAIVGTSGSGKSSLVRAGLIPALHRGTMTRAGSHWEVLVLRPGGAPLRNLARALIDADLYDPGREDVELEISATLSRSRRGLVEAVRQSDVFESGTNLLVVVDQFEELFRFRQGGVESEEAATAFVSLLLTASEAGDTPVYVAITMRSDYLGDCSEIPGLAEAVNRGEYLIPRLLRDQKRDAIEKPVRVGGARIEPRLVQRMLNRVGDDSDQLPVLQHALMRTWDVWIDDHAGDEAIDLRHFEATGGMEEALSRHADEVFEALATEAHRDACERAFKALTVKGADNRGIRRPTRLERLESLVGCDRSTLIDVLEAFRRPGVTFLMPGLDRELEERTVIDLSHESLMRIWSRLREWVEVEAQSARIYARLSDTAGLWTRGRAGFFRDPDLQIATSWRETARPTAAWAEQYGGGFDAAMDFLDRSIEASAAEEREREAARQRELAQARALAEAEQHRARERERAARRIKIFAVVIALVAVVAVAAFFRAREAEKVADQNADLAAAKEREANEAARELARILVESDFDTGGKLIEEGRTADGLAYVARALRRDPTHSPAAMRALSSLASGRFRLEEFPTIAQHRPITDYAVNKQQDLVLTSDEDLADDEAGPTRYVWDLRTGQRLYAVGDGENKIQSAFWSPDGEALFALAEGGRILIARDARSGAYRQPVQFKSPIRSLELAEHPDLGVVALVFLESSETLQVVKAGSGEAITPPPERGAAPTVFYGFSADGRRFWQVHSSAVILVNDTATGRELTRLQGKDLTRWVRFSPDGRYLAARSANGQSAAWWPVPSLETVGDTSGADSAGSGDRSEPIAGQWVQFDDSCEFWFLPGGKKIALVASRYVASGRRLEVAVHDLVTGEQIGSFAPRPATPGGPPVPARLVATLGTAEDSRLECPILAVVEGTSQNSVSLWDLESGQVLPPIQTPWFLRDVMWAPDGRRLATVTAELQVMLWDIFSRQMLLPRAIEPEGSREGSIDLAFSPDGEKLLKSQWPQHVIEFLDSRTGLPVLEPLRGVFFKDAVFSSAGDRVALHQRMTTSVGSGPRTLTQSRFHVVDLATRPVIFEPLLRGGAAGFTNAATTPDGRRFVVTGRRKPSAPFEIMVFDAMTREETRAVVMPVGVQVYNVGTAADSRHAIVGASDQRVRWLDLETGSVEREFIVAGSPRRMSLTADRQRAAFGLNPGKIAIFNLEIGAPLGELIDHGAAPFEEVRLSPDGRFIASASTDRYHHVSEVATGDKLFEPVQGTQFAQGALFLPPGGEVLLRTFSQEQRIVDLKTGEETRRIENDYNVLAAELSPHGQRLALGGGSNYTIASGGVVVWDPVTGRRVSEPLEHRSQVTTVAWSPDGQFLATAAQLRGVSSVRVWNVASGRQILDPVVDAEVVKTLEFTPDGRTVIAAWTGGAVRVIDLPPLAKPSPEWLPAVAEVVSGRRLPDGAINPVDVPREELAAVREVALSGSGFGTVERRPPDDVAPALAAISPEYAAWACWFFAKPGDRTLSPDSTRTMADYLAGLRASERLEDLLEVLRHEPSDALAHARIARALLAATPDAGAIVDPLRRHWRDSALKYAQRATELDPESPEIWAIRAEIFEELGRTEEAREALQKAASLDSVGGANVAYLQSITLAREGDWAEADAHFDRALAALSNVESNASPGPRAPLLGILPTLEPTRPGPDFRDLKLPDPIPGTFEDFEAVSEGAIPEGWVTESDGFGGFPPHQGPSLRDLSSPAVSGAIVRDAARNVGWGILLPGVPWRVGGRIPASLLRRHYVQLHYRRPGCQVPVRSLETPTYDLRGRSNVHVAFHSAFQQDGTTLGLVEYTVDDGASWLPAAYYMNGRHVVYDESGEIDAVATFSREDDEIPWIVGADGEIRGRRYGDWIRAPIDRELGSFVRPRRDRRHASSRRIEIARLEGADGQPRVRVRFARLGSVGATAWGIDDIGLYELPDGIPLVAPRRLDVTSEPAVLAGFGLRVFGGNPPSRAIDATLRASHFQDLAPASPRIEEARWIWRDASLSASTVRFRRNFNLAGKARSVHVLATGQDRIEVFLNGTSILAGDDWRTLDSRIATRHVRKGQNVLAVRLESPGELGGALFRLAILLEDGSIQTIVSDARSKMVPGAAADDRWTQAAFDDSSWKPARELGPYGMKPWARFADAGAPSGELRAAGALATRRAVRLAPGEPRVLLAAAYVNSQLGPLSEAFSLARQALEIEPRDEVADRVLASLWIARGDELAQSGRVGPAGVAYELGHRLLSPGADPDTSRDTALVGRMASVGLARESVVLVAEGSVWKYVDRGEFPPPDWIRPEFDDTSWPAGPARLGYGESRNGESLERTELDRGEDDNRRPSVHFRTSFELERLSSVARLELRLLRDDGAVVYLNGIEVVRDNMPEGKITPTEWASSTVGNQAEMTFFDHTIPTDSLRAGTNVLAVEVHQANATSSDLSFDLELKAAGGFDATALGDFAALEELESDLGIGSDLRAVLWATRARALREADELDGATRALERAAALAPDSPTVLYERACIESLGGDDDAAYRSFLSAARQSMQLKRRRAGLAGLPHLPPVLGEKIEPLLAGEPLELARIAREIVSTSASSGERDARWILRWAEELKGDHERRLATAGAWLVVGGDGVGEKVLAAARAEITAPRDETPRAARELREWLRVRELALRSLDRGEEAEEDHARIAAPPPRPEGLSSRLIDLSEHYTTSLHDARWHSSYQPNLRYLAETFRPRDGVGFDLRGLVQLGSGVYPEEVGDTKLRGKDINEALGTAFPDRVEGIRVEQKAATLHFLLGSIYGRAERDDVVARFVVHYEDGRTAEIPVLYAVDIADWANLPDELDRERIAWHGRAASWNVTRLVTRLVWENPFPDRAITHLDFVSGKGPCAPFLVAVTAR